MGVSKEADILYFGASKMTNTNPYPIITKTKPTFYFVGVTTGKSSIMKVFPLWMEALGRSDVVIEGIDYPIAPRPHGPLGVALVPVRVGVACFVKPWERHALAVVR